MHRPSFSRLFALHFRLFFCLLRQYVSAHTMYDERMKMWKFSERGRLVSILVAYSSIFFFRSTWASLHFTSQTYTNLSIFSAFKLSFSLAITNGEYEQEKKNSKQIHYINLFARNTAIVWTGPAFHAIPVKFNSTRKKHWWKIIYLRLIIVGDKIEIAFLFSHRREEKLIQLAFITDFFLSFNSMCVRVSMYIAAPAFIEARACVCSFCLLISVTLMLVIAVEKCKYCELHTYFRLHKHIFILVVWTTHDDCINWLRERSQMNERASACTSAASEGQREREREKQLVTWRMLGATMCVWVCVIELLSGHRPLSMIARWS